MPPGMEEALALRLPRALVSPPLARMAFSSEPKMPAGERGEVVRRAAHADLRVRGARECVRATGRVGVALGGGRWAGA